MKRIAVLIVLILMVTSAFASLKPEVIYYADRTALQNMCMMRGLSSSGSDEELRSLLYAYESLESYSLEQRESEDKKTENSYVLEVQNADSLSETDGVLTLTGAVSISIQTNDSDPKILSASRIIVDGELSKVTALGNAVYKDSDQNAALQEIQADIFTILWEKGDIYISGGTTSTERKNVDDDAILFYTTGETLTYLEEGAILYDNGYITSNPKHAYSSISAKKLELLPGQDMFLTQAWFNIGRVPILYLPAFVFPGSKILGNPNFGFSSTKGAFVNTTFELLGSYPKFKEQDDSSSFTAILKSASEEDQNVLNGYYYGEGELSPLQKWASQTNSYLALMADAYQGNGVSENILPFGGLHLGMDSEFNLLSNKLKIRAVDAVAFSSPVLNDGSKVRYYGDNSLSYNDFGASVSVSVPFYSDSLVRRDFSNRLSGFSIEPLLGNESEFPTDYSSAISRFSRTLTASYNLPSKYTNSFISSFSISNFSISANYLENSGHRSSYGASDYTLDTLVLPSLNARVSGSILKWTLSTTKNAKEDSVLTVENNAAEDVDVEDDTTTEEELHPLEDVLLLDLYQIKDTEVSSTKAKTGTYSLKVDYNITENLNNNQDYKEGEKQSNSTSSTTSSKITLSGSARDYLSITNNLVPSVTVSKYNTYLMNGYTSRIDDKVSVSDDLTVSSSKLGLTYNLGLKVYSLNETKSLAADGTEIVNSSEKIFAWEKEFITTHKLTLSKSLKTDLGTFSGSVSYTIPPLNGTLLPSVSWSKGKYSASASWKFVEEEDHTFRRNLITMTGKYNGRNLVFSSTGKYQSKDYDSGDFWKPFSAVSSLQLKDSSGKYSLMETIDYTRYSTSLNVKDYFASIKTSFRMDVVSGNLLYKSNEYGDVRFASFDLSANVSTQHVQFWKGRVYCAFSLKTNLVFNKENLSKSSFNLNPTFTFSVAEFLDINLSVSTQNNQIQKYFVGNEFSWSLLLEDLKRSLDFVGDGRRNTSFIMKNISLEFVHYMEDWDLNCAYSTELVKSGKVYTLQPSLSFYLSWKTMPDLKAEERWKQVRYNDGSTEWQQY